MSGKFSVFLVCEDLTFGVSLLKSTTYAQLVTIARKSSTSGKTMILSYHTMLEKILSTLLTMMI
jgi:hypothetical protein